MTRWTLLLPALLVACSEPTAPTVECQGTLEVTVTVTRFGADTAVVCAFPTDSTPPPQPPDTCRKRHRHDHHHHPRGHR